MEALNAKAVRGHLRAEIVYPLVWHLQFRRTRSITSCCNDTRPVETNGRDAQSLLEDVRVSAVDEIGVMRQVRDPGDDRCSSIEDRFQEDDIV